MGPHQSLEVMKSMALMVCARDTIRVNGPKVLNQCATTLHHPDDDDSKLHMGTNSYRIALRLFVSRSLFFPSCFVRSMTELRLFLLISFLFVSMCEKLMLYYEVLILLLLRKSILNLNLILTAHCGFPLTMS